MTKAQFEAVVSWQKRNFPVATPLSKVFHLETEVAELKKDLIDKKEDRRLEYADCFMLLFGAAASDGMSYEDICDAIREKFEINLIRKWGKPYANGVVNHIK